jgi:hypothetical protein
MDTSFPEILPVDDGNETLSYASRHMGYKPKSLDQVWAKMLEPKRHGDIFILVPPPRS